MSQVSENHWLSWHQAYDDPGSALSHRLAAVQQQIRAALAAAPPGPLRVTGNWSARRILRVRVHGNVSAGQSQQIRNFLKMTLKG